MRSFLVVAALIHVAFMLAELFPWRIPLLLGFASKKLPVLNAKGDRFTDLQLPLVAAIVHNAGIYNGIVAGGLVWAAISGSPLDDVARVMLCGAAVAGVFGAVTLKNPVPLVQALVGIVGLFLV